MNGADDPFILFAIAGGFGAVALVIVLAAMALASGRGRASKRVTAIAKRWQPEAAAASGGTLRKDVAESGFGGLDRFARNWLPRREALRARLDRSGRNITLGKYIIVCAIMAFATLFLVRLFYDRNMPVALLAAVAGGVGLPHLVIGLMIGRRAAAFVSQFPDAIDLIVRGLRSGLPIQETIGTISAEIPDPVGGEFRRIDAALKLGQNLDEALWGAADRMATPEFRFFVISLSVQRETGGNLAETLQNLGDLLRRRRQMKLKIKAMSSEAKASAYIIGSLPFIMLAFLLATNAGYVMPLFEDPRGNMLVGVGLFSIALGAGVMAKMVRFEI
jgi:tight adherence protein B